MAGFLPTETNVLFGWRTGENRISTSPRAPRQADTRESKYKPHCGEANGNKTGNSTRLGKCGVGGLRPHALFLDRSRLQNEKLGVGELGIDQVGRELTAGLPCLRTLRGWINIPQDEE